MLKENNHVKGLKQVFSNYFIVLCQLLVISEMPVEI
jgi:hypothetical protein